MTLDILRILGNGDLYIVANFQANKNIALKLKRWMKVSVFDVTFAHRGVFLG